MPRHDDKESQEHLVNILRQAVESDEALREKYQVGDKFRFVRDRLQALLHKAEQDLPKDDDSDNQADKNQNAALDEAVVYVHLYNAKGTLLRNWQAMLTPKVFYEYSVNRPIYTEKAHIDNLLRSKGNKAQHAYLSIVVKKADILQPVVGAIRKDIIGNPLVKIKEGALDFQRLVAFTHNEQDFVLNAQGELVRKEVKGDTASPV
jgi:hypothetical protein